MNPIRITVSGGKEAALIADALHCLNGSQSAWNQHAVTNLFAQHEINTVWEDTRPPQVQLGDTVTRDGRKARVICIDRAGPYQVLALIPDPRGIECLNYYYLDGTRGERPQGTDLVGHLTPVSPEPREWDALVNAKGELHNWVPLETLGAYTRVRVREVMP